MTEASLRLVWKIAFMRRTSTSPYAMRNRMPATVASGRYAASGRRIGGEEAADEIRNALANEFLVRVDALAGPDAERAADADAKRKRKNGRSERGWRGLGKRVDGQVRHRERRQLRGQRADGRDPGNFADKGCIKREGEHATGDGRGDHERDLLQVALRKKAGHDREHADARHPRIDLVDLERRLTQRLNERGVRRNRDAEERFQLLRGNENCGARAEPDDDGVRDEIDQCAKPREAHHQLE